MIIIGKKKPRLINPAHIIEVYIVEGTVTVFAEGETDNDGDVTITSFNVREPYTVVIKHALGVGYINCKDYDEAFLELTKVLTQMGETNILEIERTYTKVYGKTKK